MNEIRKDYVLDRWLVVTKNRAKRPRDFIKEKPERKEKVCPFCPGNEHMTPPETYRVGDAKKWVIRCFENKFPALTKRARWGLKPAPWKHSPAFGFHEVIVETEKHGRDFSDLPAKHMTDIVNTYFNRIRTHSGLKGVKYVLVFKNEGGEAGASIQHSHTQLTALPFVPPLVREEEGKSKEIYEKKGSRCVYCSVLEKEMKSERRVYENENFAIFTPYASIYPFETWVLPKRHLCLELTSEERRDFGEALKVNVEALNKALGARVPYNFYLHYSPKGSKYYHMHLELCPRLITWAGFELGGSMIMNSMPPEEAADTLRREI
jgi:UDPglucose--hexose-1-phosphate uridylyltransferase